MTTISLGTSEGAVNDVRATASVAWTRLTRTLQTTWCVVNGGHHKVLHTEPDRMALRCVACGHTSPGWAVGTTRVARRYNARGADVSPRRESRAVRRTVVA